MADYTNRLRQLQTGVSGRFQGLADVAEQRAIDLDISNKYYQSTPDEVIVDADTIGKNRLMGYDAFESTAGVSSNEKARKLEEAGISLAQQKELGLQGKHVLQDYMQQNPNKLFVKSASKDVFGRSLLRDDELAQHMVESGTAVPTDRYDEKLQSIYRAKQEKLRRTDPVTAQAMEIQREYNIGRQKLGIGTRIGEAVDAFQSGTQQSLAGTADFVLDVVTPGDNTLLNKVKSAEVANEAWGYDSREADFAKKEALHKFKNKEYVGSVMEMAKSPELWGESLPMIAEMAVGAGKFTALGKLMKLGTQGLKGADKIAEAKKIRDGATAMEKATLLGAENAGFLGVVGDQTNRHIEEFTANNEGVGPTYSQIAGMTAMNVLQLGLDRMAFGQLIATKGGIQALKDTVMPMLKVIPDNALGTIAKKVATTATGITAAMGTEAGQEYIQSWAEMLNTKAGTKKYGDWLAVLQNPEAQDEAIIGALAGAGMGGQMRAGVEIPGAVMNVGGAVTAGVDTFRTRAPKMSDAERREVELAGGVPTSDVGYTKQTNEYTTTFKKAMQSNDMITAKGSIDEYLQQTQTKLDAGELEEGSPEYIDTKTKLTEMYGDYYKKAQKTVTPEFQAAAREYKRLKGESEEPIDVLGSSEQGKALGRNIQDIIDSGTVLDDADTAEMETLAKDLGIDTTQYKVEQEALKPIRELEATATKTMNRVTYESLIGENGVQRVYEKLKAAVKAKDNNAAVGFMRQLENFKTTQVSKVEALQKGLEQYKIEVESNPKAKVEVPYSKDPGKKFIIGVEGKVDTPKYAINAANKVIEEASTTVGMLDKVLQAVKIKAPKEVVQEAKPTEEVQTPKVDKVEPVKQSKSETYEVSTKGDKRYSALVAKLKDGRTIEEAYQLDVKGYRAKSNNWRDGKGKPPLNKGVDLQAEYTKLWEQYFKENPKLYTEIRDKVLRGVKLTDMFSRKGGISQADTIMSIVAKEVETPTEVTETQVEETKPKEVVKDTTEVKEGPTEVKKQPEGKDTRIEDEKQIDKMNEYLEAYSEEISKLKSEKIVIKKNIENHKAMIYRYKGKWSRALQEYKKAKEDTWLKELKTLIIAIKNEIEKFVSLIAKHKAVISEEYKKIEDINNRMKEIGKNVERIKETKESMTKVDGDTILDSAADPRVKDMLEASGKKVKSILALSPETRKTMMWSMRKIYKKYPELVSLYGDMQLKAQAGKVQKISAKTLEDMKNESPIRMLFDKQGNMPQEMAEAMSIEVVNYIANKISDLSYNDDVQIKKMLGVKDSAIVPNSVRQAMKGIGRFYKLEAQSIGKGILKNMGLKQKDSVDMDTQTRLEADIGALAIAVMEDMGMIEYSSELTTTDYLDYKAKIEHDNGIEYSDASEVLRGEGDTISTVKMNLAVSKSSIDQNRKMMDQIEEDLGIESYNKKPTLKPLEKQDTMRGMEKETQIPKKQQKVLKKLRNQPWTINTKRVQALKDMYTKDKQAVLEMFGWEDPKMVWVDKRDAVESKNRDIEQSIESIIEYTEKVGTKEIFLDWFFSKNGRFFVDSTKINPQTDKIHRFLMSPVGSVSTIDDKNRDTFKLGVVQAFDGSADTIELEDGTRVKDLGAIDKQSMEASIKDFDTLMEKHSQAIKDVKAGKTTTKAVLEAINGTDHPMHALAALEAMGQYREVGSFETDLTIETDAVTSGFILGMLLNPVMSYAKVKEWLAKGGVWLGGTKAKSYGEYASTEGNLDAYNTGAKGTADTLEKMIDAKPILGKTVKALEGLVKVDRKFMKQPFMVFIYGSGIDNIKKNISVQYADKLMEMLASDKDNETALEVINSLLRINDMPSVSMTAEQARETSLTGMSQDSATLNRIYKIAIKAVESTYGDAVGNYLGTEFGQIVSMRKAMNKAYVAMFKEFKKEYDKRVKFDATKEEVDAVLNEMMTEGKIPGIFTVHSDRENKGEKLVVADKAVISPKGLRGQKVKIQSKFTDRMSPPNRTLNPMIREMVEAPASGAVLGIHMVDGSIMSDTLENTIGLGVHDAVVSAISDAVETAKDYSNTTWNITQSYDLLGEIIAQTPKSEWELIADLKEFRDTAIRNKELMSKEYVEIEHMSIPGAKVSIGEDKSKPMSETKVQEILQDTPNEVVNGIVRLKGKVSNADMNAIISVIKQFKEC